MDNFSCVDFFSDFQNDAEHNIEQRKFITLSISFLTVISQQSFISSDRNIDQIVMFGKYRQLNGK